jgi:hypothetical protein
VKVAVRLKESGMSNRAIAVSLGVSRETVRNDMRSGGKFLPRDLGTVTGLDGKPYPASRPKPSTPEPDSYDVRQRICYLGVTPRHDLLIDQRRLDSAMT